MFMDRLNRRKERNILIYIPYYAWDDDNKNIKNVAIKEDD